MVFANAASVHETSTERDDVGADPGVPAVHPGLRARGRGRHWAPAWHPSLADRTVLLIGYGGVGRAIESRLLAFETTVVRARSRTNATTKRSHSTAFDSTAELLPTADIVVSRSCSTESTHHLVDAEFLSAMPDGSLFVNIARGGGRRHRRVAGRARSPDDSDSPSTSPIRSRSPKDTHSSL